MNRDLVHLPSAVRDRLARLGANVAPATAAARVSPSGELNTEQFFTFWEALGASSPPDVGLRLATETQVHEYDISSLAALHSPDAGTALSKLAVPGMRERRWGRVIQISSRNAISPHAHLGPYGASKAALNNFTLSLSKALAGTGVTSNGIMPGLIETPALDGWFREIAAKQGLAEPAEGRTWVLKNVVHQTVGRLGAPADIAAAVCFLASPLTDFMTGTTFRIDGGATPTV